MYEGINDLYANHVEPSRYREDYAHLGPWYVRGPLYDNPEGYDPVPVEFWGPPEWVREGLQRTNVVIHEVARETGTPLFDAERVLGRDPRWFGDVCHPSDAGVDRLVDALAVFLVEQRAR